MAFEIIPRVSGVRASARGPEPRLPVRSVAVTRVVLPPELRQAKAREAFMAALRETKVYSETMLSLRPRWSAVNLPPWSAYPFLAILDFMQRSPQRALRTAGRRRAASDVAYQLPLIFPQFVARELLEKFLRVRRRVPIETLQQHWQRLSRVGFVQMRMHKADSCLAIV